ncbi:MAG: NAD-dependent epimerase/dehydratase family protein, partial [Candidatus Zixiibacteriota bacterium]
LTLTYRFGDITQPETLPDMVRDVDIIVHNAGLVKARRAEQFFEVNERGTAALFGAIVAHAPGVKRVVQISSVAASGPSTEGRPRCEADTPSPITTYGQSKLAGEQAALAHADKLSVVAIRPPGVYGPGDREIFSFFSTVHNRIKPYIGNSSRRLQLVHVDDLARAVYCAATAEVASGTVLFAAEKASYSMNELIQLLANCTGKRCLPVYIPAPLFKLVAAAAEASSRTLGIVPMLTREKARELLSWWELDTDRARDLIGFESSIPFADGARQTYDWYIREGWLS